MQAARRARDAWLALRCQSSEPGAYEQLFAEMEQPLFYYLRQLVRNQDLALELLQETWIRALRTFSKLKDPASVRAWLYTLAHGIAIDHIRRDQVRRRANRRNTGSKRAPISVFSRNASGPARCGDASHFRNPIRPSYE